MKKKALTLFVIVCVCLSLFMFIPPINEKTPTKHGISKFIIASWDYPKDYGQGIYMIRFYENSTGSWVDAPWYYKGGELDGLPFYSLHSYDPYTLNWSAGVAMKLRVHCCLNSTLTGAIDLDDGQNYHRHNVTVTTAGTTIFSQQNITYYDDYEPIDEIYCYIYEVVLNFLPEQGQIYTIAITYEVFYESLGEYGGSYLHDCSDTSDMTYNSNGGLDPSDYGIGSNGSVVEIWIVPDSVAAEYVVYKLDLPNFVNTDSDINLIVRYRVEDGYIGFRLDLYYDDASYDSTGLQTSQTWANLTIVADSGKTLDYALLRCQDNPASVTSGNRSVYVDFIEITSSGDSLVFLFDQWNLVSTATLIFSVSLDYWGLNMSLVFGGLILMLLSACIVAKKVRDRNITNDAGILLLFLFCVGWGLFIGGTIIG